MIGDGSRPGLRAPAISVVRIQTRRKRRLIQVLGEGNRGFEGVRSAVCVASCRVQGRARGVPAPNPCSIDKRR